MNYLNYLNPFSYYTVWYSPARNANSVADIKKISELRIEYGLITIIILMIMDLELHYISQIGPEERL